MVSNFISDDHRADKKNIIVKLKIKSVQDKVITILSMHSILFKGKEIGMLNIDYLRLCNCFNKNISEKNSILQTKSFCNNDE